MQNGAPVSTSARIVCDLGPKLSRNDCDVQDPHHDDSQDCVAGATLLWSSPGPPFDLVQVLSRCLVSRG
jgi:hypothetical protein